MQRRSKSDPLSRLLFLHRAGPSRIDGHTVLLALNQCVKTSPPTQPRQLHALMFRLGFSSLSALQTTLISAYSQCGNLADARRMFGEITHRNVVSWTALISAYVNHNRPDDALRVFRQMQADHVEPDRVALTIALSACADAGARETGEWIHAYARRAGGFEDDLFFYNALLNMYAKCGDVGTSRRLFDGARRRDVTTWTSMIVGHALHGQAEDALLLFDEMKRSCAVVPNGVTFVGVLMACSHAGFVGEARRHLESMSWDYGLEPRISHYGCVVDLLCRSGLLKEAHTLIESMPIRPNAVIWRTLLAAASLRGDSGLACHARRSLLELEPGYDGDDVAMSNAYAAAGLWNEKENVREKMEQKRVPGCSSIEVESRVHEFVSADKSHALWREMHGVLRSLAENSRLSETVLS
ncbi:putative pentatricopeptide repeat-containing protein [Acorus calamus]|uniref:Pentatricopeptide repeat-containing protein n=1 Tax=Acorus calamus TaxID=4465 RepID=A0AAV9E2R5_ACOCL|nr:putative pentatricopeptide repeat-containing protein [Acorus calamus]